jgi:translation initiation factor 2-alpha kinase 4
VPWLHGQIAEQKRIDATTSGITLNHDVTQSGPAVKDLPMSSDVQLLLPGDAKKQRKQTKQMFMDRGTCTHINTSWIRLT